MKNLTKRQLALIRRLRKLAHFERANFNEIGAPNVDMGVKGGEVASFVKERTRIYRESWLDPAFAELLGEAPPGSAGPL